MSKMSKKSNNPYLYDYQICQSILTDVYKGYRGTIEWSEEGKSWFGKVLGIKDCIVYSSDQHGAIEQEFRASVDDYLEMCSEIGKEPNVPHIAHEINAELDAQLRTTLDCLEAICDIADDYDGERSIRGVLDLIGQMVGIAQYGRSLT